MMLNRVFVFVSYQYVYHFFIFLLNVLVLELFSLFFFNSFLHIFTLCRLSEYIRCDLYMLVFMCLSVSVCVYVRV